MPGAAGAAAIGGVASIAGGLLGGSGAKKAAQAQQAAQAAAIAEQRRQFDITQQNLQPFIDVGAPALQQLQTGATAQGLDQRLADIFSGASFQNLADERTRAAQAGLASAGLTRSGAGLQAIAGVPGDLALQLESLLSGRQGQLAGIGQQSAGQLGGFGQAAAGNISQLLAQQGRTAAQGILGQGQADASRNQALIQGIGQLAAGGIGLFGGGGPADVSLADVGGIAGVQGANPSNPIATNTGQFTGPLFPVG